MNHSDTTRFLIPGHTGLCNALRRTLLSDLRTEAPCSVRMLTNVTCHTDEFIAHRVGLIPFRRIGNGDTMNLHKTGPCVVTSGDLTGPCFESVHPNIELVYLDAGHELHMDVIFDEQCASAHSRYSPCYAVGMCPSEKEDHHIISFGSNDHRTPKQLLHDAFDHMSARIDRALLLLADETTCESFI